MADNQNIKNDKREWATQAMGKITGDDDSTISPEMLEEEAVMLLYGDNMFGDPIYSYIKFTLRNFRKMREAMIEGIDFMPSDYGSVLAAGRGEPPQTIRDEMRVQYGVTETPRPKRDEPEPIGAPKISLFDEDDGF